MSEITRRQAVVRAAAAAAAVLTGTAAVVAAQPTAPRGYGHCSKCNCRRFEGTGSTCANRGCGHAYSDHYA